MTYFATIFHDFLPLNFQKSKTSIFIPCLSRSQHQLNNFNVKNGYFEKKMGILKRPLKKMGISKEMG